MFFSTRHFYDVILFDYALLHFYNVKSKLHSLTSGIKDKPWRFKRLVHDLTIFLGNRSRFDIFCWVLPIFWIMYIILWISCYSRLPVGSISFLAKFVDSIYFHSIQAQNKFIWKIQSMCCSWTIMDAQKWLIILFLFKD